MKKFFCIMVVLLMFFAVSCNQEIKEYGTSGSRIALEKESGREALIAQGSKPLDGAKAIDHTGFVIKSRWTYTENGNQEKTFITLGGKDGFFWIGINNEDGEEDSVDTQYYYFYESGNVKYYYWDGTWTSIDSVALSNFSFRNMMMRLTDFLIYGAYNYNGLLIKGASDVVLGRACTKYTYTGTSYGVSLSIMFYVDDEYGITLNQEFVGDLGQDVVGFNFEMLPGTKFNSVQLSDLPASHPADINPMD